MSIYNHETALTQFVEGAGMRFAYRRFANTRGAGILEPSTILQTSCGFVSNP